MPNTSSKLNLELQHKNSPWFQILDLPTFGFTPTPAGLLSAGLTKLSTSTSPPPTQRMVQLSRLNTDQVVSAEPLAEMLLPSVESPDSKKMGLITSASGKSFELSKMSGIIGLAYSSISVNALPTWMEVNSLAAGSKSFTFYLNSNPTKSYMTFPAQHTSTSLNTHSVIEQKYWALNLKNINNGTTDVATTGYKGVIDSGTSLLVGPKAIIDEVIAGITVKSDCSTLASLPTISFTIDDNVYPLAPTDYVLQVEGECLMGIASMAFPKGFDYVIMGDVFMRKYPSTFDLDNNNVIFQV